MASPIPPPVPQKAPGTIKVINHAKGEHRIDLGRLPKSASSDIEAAQGPHRGYIDLMPGENFIDKERWALAMKNEAVRIHVNSNRRDREGKRIDLEVE